MKIAHLLSLVAMGNFSASSGLGIAPRRITPRIHRDSLPLAFGPHHVRGGSSVHKTSALKSASDPSSRGGAAEPKGRRGLDFVAVTKYCVGMGVQLSLICGIFTAIDKVVAKYALKIPFAANFIFFYLFNLKTAALWPLKRQNEAQEEKNYVKPSWTPPGYVFAIMWPLFVFGVRAATAAMIVSSSDGIFATPTLMFLMLHLGFGTLWSTVNNVERRLGFSVPVLFGLLFSNLYASYRFYLINPLAGKLLAATSTWLGAAAALEANTWWINPDPETGEPEPLYPAKDSRWKTKFRWED